MCYIIALSDYARDYPEAVLYKVRLSSFGRQQEPAWMPDATWPIALNSLPAGALGSVEYFPTVSRLHAITFTWIEPKEVEYFFAALDGAISTVEELGGVRRGSSPRIQHAAETIHAVQEKLGELTSGADLETRALFAHGTWQRISARKTPSWVASLEAPDWYRSRIDDADEFDDVVIRGLIAAASVEAIVTREH
ncbi:MAG: hypothetical protein AAFQ31_05635 [Planctomycetota bacterium]